MASNLRLSTPTDEVSDSWISIADLMAGLMMIFLLLAVWHSAQITERAEEVSTIVEEWQDLEEAIYFALAEEFKEDLPRWQAEIERETLTIRFREPKVFFKQNSAELQPRFKTIIQDFFPRYIRVLRDGFANNIREVRIEGHTSSEFGGLSGRDAFIENMRLSQARTRATMEYAINLERVSSFEEWVIKTVTANGLSSGRVILSATGEENKQRSRRVEFTIHTKTKEALFEILDTLSNQKRAAAMEQ